MYKSIWLIRVSSEKPILSVFVLGPILYVAFVFVSTHVRCTMRLKSKKSFFLIAKVATVFDKNSLKTKLVKPHEVFFELFIIMTAIDSK